MKIWALFSVDNNYDQPENNLVCWWANKPTIEGMTTAVGWAFPAHDDSATLAIVDIWAGKDSRISEVRYRLQEIEEGKPLDG